MSISGIENWAHAEFLESLVKQTIQEDISSERGIPGILTRRSVLAYHGMSLENFNSLIRFGYFRPPASHDLQMRSVFHAVPNPNSSILSEELSGLSIYPHPVLSAIRYATSVSADCLLELHGTDHGHDVMSYGSNLGVVLGIAASALREFDGYKITPSTDDIDFPDIPEMVLGLKKGESGNFLLPTAAVVSSIHPVGDEANETIQAWFKASRRLQKV